MKKPLLLVLLLELAVVAAFLAVPTSAIAGDPVGDRFVISNNSGSRWLTTSTCRSL